MAFGRPKKEFSWEKFVQLCGMPSPIVTNKQIAEIMDVSEDTIERRIKEHYPALTFADFRATCYTTTKSKLFAAQMKQALKGNPQLLIHLGKNYLGQDRDIQRSEVTVKDEDQTAKDLALQLNKIQNDKRTKPDS